jgi:hypothetical protein
MYSALCSLLGVLPMPAAAPGGLPLWHSPLGQCRAVLGISELMLGFLAPTLVLVAAESDIYRRYARQCQAAQWQLEGAGQGAGHQAGTASAAAAGASSNHRDSDTGSNARLPQAAAQHHHQQQQGSVPQSGELKPPSSVEASAYRCLHAILHPVDAADWTTTWLINILLFGAAWQIVLLLTPPLGVCPACASLRWPGERSHCHRNAALQMPFGSLDFGCSFYYPSAALRLPLFLLLPAGPVGPCCACLLIMFLSLRTILHCCQAAMALAPTGPLSCIQQFGHTPYRAQPEPTWQQQAQPPLG